MMETVEKKTFTREETERLLTQDSRKIIARQKAWQAWYDACPVVIFCRANKISVPQLSRMSGASYPCMRSWKTGCTRPNAEHMAALARAMGVSHIDLEHIWDAWMKACPK